MGFLSPAIADESDRVEHLKRSSRTFGLLASTVKPLFIHEASTRCVSSSSRCISRKSACRVPYSVHASRRVSRAPRREAITVRR